MSNKIRTILYISGVSPIPCSNCGGLVREFSVPNDIWNDVVRENKGETDNEYLCMRCFASAFVRWYKERVKNDV